MERGEGSLQVRARIAGVFYLLTIVFGALALAFPNGRVPANLFATACYAAVTVLFYGMFTPVNKSLSLLAAFFGLVGCAVGALSAFDLAPLGINSLVFFGCYCLLIGTLIFKSTFLPRILGVLIGFGGLGWLTFASPSLAKSLFPYSMAPGILGESALTLWLLVMGVNVQRWNEQASAAENRGSPAHQGARAT
jgi:hypothetical protein